MLRNNIFYFVFHSFDSEFDEIFGSISDDSVHRIILFSMELPFSLGKLSKYS